MKMKRRHFIQAMTASTGLWASGLSLKPESATAGEEPAAPEAKARFTGRARESYADVVIVGSGLGGCAAALAALRNGLRVILTEETDWIGGQLTSQGVPPDEHGWIESHGATRLYRDFRTAIRRYYRDFYPLTAQAAERTNLNPGDGGVSRLCHEPRVALAVLYQLFAPYLGSGKLQLLLEHEPVSAHVDGDRVKSVTVLDRRDGHETILSGPYFVDATELGDLLPLTGTEFRAGAESIEETGELHAAKRSDPANQQAFTACFAMDYEKGADHRIEKPVEYEFWKNFVPKMDPPWPGPLLDLTYCKPSTLKPLRLGFHPEGVRTGSVLNLWNYRRIINPANFAPGTYVGGATIVNWPQNDYVLGNLDGSKEEFQRHFERAKQLSLSLFYWLQTEVPRPDGGQGWHGLRLRGDLLGTRDGMAKYPYVRESRRIKALFTVLEEHVGKANREKVLGQPTTRAAEFDDSVGVGYYHIDLHPSSGGDNYIDFPSLRFQIPLGALIPQRIVNLLPANKNIGTTHITNGCYRLHPVEWGIGEAVGMLVFYAMQKKTGPRAVRETKTLSADFRSLLHAQGIETAWPNDP